MMRSDNTFAMVAAISRGMDHFIMDALKARGLHGLVSSHGSIIKTLMERDACTMNALAAEIGKTPQTVTSLVKKLVQLGLVQSAPSANDKRTTLVSLTDEGRALKDVFDDISAALYETQYRGFNEAEIVALRGLLTRMQENLSVVRS